MVNNASKIINLLTPPKANQHPLLQQLSAQLHGTEAQEAFTISGHTYTLRTLTPFEESWADGFVDGANFYQTGRNRRAPYVAAALMTIDNVSVKELFQLPDDADAETKQLVQASSVLEDDWRRREVLRWLVVSIPSPVLAELWTSYQTLEVKRNESLEKIGPLSATTASGESSLTSLLANKS
jgi:hypothetical protein